MINRQTFPVAATFNYTMDRQIARVFPNATIIDIPIILFRIVQIKITVPDHQPVHNFVRQLEPRQMVIWDDFIK